MSQELSFTAASSTLNIATTTAVLPLTLTSGTDSVSGNTCIPQQVASVFASCATAPSTNTAVLCFILYDPSAARKRAIFEATVAVSPNVTAYRDSSDGASGRYVLSVVFGDGTNKIDLNGYAEKVSSTSGVSVSDLVWYVGVATNASLGDLTVLVKPTRSI